MYNRSLKHPITALIIAIIACGFALVMNTQMKLGERVQAVEDGFFTSVAGERSIYSRLEEKLDAANGLWTVLEGVRRSRSPTRAAACSRPMRAATSPRCTTRTPSWTRSMPRR